MIQNKRPISLVDDTDNFNDKKIKLTDSIPYEIIEIILAYIISPNGIKKDISFKDLLNFALASKQFYQIQKRLFPETLIFSRMFNLKPPTFIDEECLVNTLTTLTQRKDDYLIEINHHFINEKLDKLKCKTAEPIVSLQKNIDNYKYLIQFSGTEEKPIVESRKNTFEKVKTFLSLMVFLNRCENLYDEYLSKSYQQQKDIDQINPSRIASLFKVFELKLMKIINNLVLSANCEGFNLENQIQNLEHIYKIYPVDLKGHISLCKYLVMKDPYFLRQCPDEIRDDFNVVMYCVCYRADVDYDYALLLEFASDRLKNNKQIVIEAVNNWCVALKYASKELRDDVEIINFALNNMDIDSYHEIPLLFFCGDNIRKNRDLVLRAVQFEGLSILAADPSLLSDDEILQCAWDNVWEPDYYVSILNADEMKMIHDYLNKMDHPISQKIKIKLGLLEPPPW